MEQDFEQIYQTYAPDLYYFILQMCRNEHLAMDILQDTMLKAVISIDQFKGECSMKTWLCTIAKHIYFDYLKKAETKNISLESLPEYAEQNHFEQQIYDTQQALQIHKVLHCLEEPYREIFMLKVFAELKYKDIGAIFHQSENWAGVMFYRAKKKLIKLLQEEDIL
ncbi:MAG: sigma-70 family RNA polymerase sigma factor [Oscillospiraceae bacterium]|nr:sigma-70 family RNA polymerase sigma factor [Oscillospiraceae bacterium]